MVIDARPKLFLFLFQFLAHISFIAALFLFSFADWGASLFVYFLTGCLGVSITFHRYLAHKSWKAPLWWVYLGSLLGFWGIVGSPIAWANNHVAHHKYVDTERDPHSPTFMPWWKIQWLAMFTSYTSFRFALSNLNKFQLFLHKHYFKLHLIIVIFLFFMFGLHIVMVWYLVPSAILWNASSLINTINHNYGYRNFLTKDSSTNNIGTGYLVWGEGWHNNHHARPGNYNFRVKWWEFDLSSVIINLILSTRKKNE